MRRRNPAALSFSVTNEQPTVPGILNDDFLSTLHRQFTRRVIVQYHCFPFLMGEHLYWHPTFTTIRRLAPFPARKLIIFASHSDSLASNNLKRVGVLDFVFELYSNSMA